MNIEEIFKNAETDKARYVNSDGNMSGHAYANMYELITSYVDTLHDWVFSKATHIMEIGYETGAGAYALSRIFPDYSFVSLDINFSNDRFPNQLKPRFEKITCDCGNRGQVKNVASYLSDIKFGLIIDDASHLLEHQMLCLEEFWKLLAPGGLYIIEDIYTLEQAYTFKDWPGFMVIDTRPNGAANDICVVLRRPFEEKNNNEICKV